jgi:hypothetical protein
MKYAVEMGSGTMIYKPSLIKIRQLIAGRRGFTDTQRAWR